jgi:hypothetical protein
MKHNIVERELEKIKTDARAMIPYVDKPEWDSITLAGIAAIIASVYSGYENIFRYLCKDKVQKSEHWHMDLLKSAIANDLIPSDIEDILRDMLSFRHIQRNYYGHQLKEPRVRQKAKEVLNIVIPTFDKHLKRFLDSE